MAFIAFLFFEYLSVQKIEIMEAVRKNIYNTVLLVDDSRIDNFINRKMLESTHFATNILVINKTIEALSFLSDLDKSESDEELIPSFIFLDLNMPVLNGHEFIEEYGKLSPNITKRCKIIILTNSVDPSERVSTMNNKNVILFVQKPLIVSNIKFILKEVEKLTAIK